MNIQRFCPTGLRIVLAFFTVVSIERFYFRTVASSKAAGGHYRLPRGGGTRIEAPKAQESRRRRCREGGEWGGGVHLPNRLGGLGERRELPRGVRGRAPAECIFGIFEAHRTAQKVQFFVKSPLNRSIRGHGHWTISPWLSSGGGALGFSVGARPTLPPLATGLFYLLHKLRSYLGRERL